ncbi:MAG: methylenetetrahydrofolate reductase [NAD(P)H] [Gammaproteobacteria bacterium]|nr:methylenetetrahydrofolate reductase [NAD(P)H] [Gammaproteobacteria bacterium]
MADLSFEFFPPRTAAGSRTLVKAAKSLLEGRTAWCSVTYGAGGSTRDGTFETVSSLHEAGIDIAPHLSWGRDREEDVLGLIRRYITMGVNRVVALRGDRPSGVGSGWQGHYAEDLVRFIRQRVSAPIEISVAAYPEVHPDAPSAQADLEFLKRKLDAGADTCITQYFYNADAYFDFRDRCEAAGISAPIVAGIMPITNYRNLVRFSDKCGAEIPRWLRHRLADLDGDDEALADLGADVVTGLCQRLLEGDVPGIHFYTLNRAAPTLRVLGNLGP